jgi:hypothetical protein
MEHFIDYQKLDERKEELNKSWNDEKKPFRYIVFEDFFSPEYEIVSKELVELIDLLLKVENKIKRLMKSNSELLMIDKEMKECKECKD